ncbi:MAG: autotransporter outer membrane beta-barrel domain-containing protein [Bradyrhizobium sp.]
MLSIPGLRRSLIAAAIIANALFLSSSAWAVCSPAAGPGAPPSGTTVTCSGTTTNQNPPDGYGDVSQNGVTINVLNGASVIGTSAGFALSGLVTANTVSNSGTIKDDGSNPAGFNGIVAPGSLTLTNNGSGIISGTSTNPGAAVIGVNVSNVQGSNAGSITVTGSGNETAGISANNVTFTNTGTISATGSTVSGTFGVLGLSVALTNGGTISASGGTGTTGTAVESISGTLNVTNKAGGLITGTEINTTSFTFGVFAGGTGAAVINNAGTIHGDDAAIGSQSTTSNTIINTGTISGGGFGAIRFFGTAASNVENAGIITEASGAAIRFAGSNNVLTLDPGSSITGNVMGTGADKFQLGGATGNDTFNVNNIGGAQQYQGFTTFNKVGGSTWLLTGIGTQTWNVSGGVLGGTATIGGLNVQPGGTFMPGNGTPGSLMSVAGNLAFQSGGQYLVQLNPATSSFANVTGTTMPGGATVGANYTSGGVVAKKYTILTATGGVNGTFNPVVSTNLGGNFTTSLSYDTHDVFLSVALNFVNPGGLNQQSVANILSNFFNVTGSAPLAFGSLTSAGLTQAAGETATGSQQTTFDAMTQFMSVMTDPFVAGRGDPLTTSIGAPAFAGENDDALAYAANGTQRARSERDAYVAIYRKAPPMADPVAQRWSLWAAGFGGSQTTDGNTVLGSNTATSRIAGTAVGADYRFSPFTLAGFALAGGGTSFSVANGGSGRSDLFQAGAFIRHNIGPAYITGALAYGWQDITTDRTLTIAGVDRLHAEFNANAFSGRAEGGYRFVRPWMGGVGITPYAAGQFTTFDLPAYAEQVLSGANTFALAYGSRSVTDTRSELGVRTDRSYAMQDGFLTLRGRFAWAHDFNPDRNIAANFQALPGASFVVNGAAQASDSALVTASIEKKWLNGWSAAATFEGEFSNVTRSYAGKGVVRYSW